MIPAPTTIMGRADIVVELWGLWACESGVEEERLANEGIYTPLAKSPAPIPTRLSPTSCLPSPTPPDDWRSHPKVGETINGRLFQLAIYSAKSVGRTAGPLISEFANPSSPISHLVILTRARSRTALQLHARHLIYATALGGSRPRANRPMGPFPTCPYKTLYTPHTPSSGFPPLTARRPIPSMPTTKMTTGQKVLDARYDVSLPPARLAVSRRTSS
jgi:hypothetical protein